MRCLDDTAAGIRGFPLRLWFSSCLCLLVSFDARKKTELSTNSSLHGCFHDCKADGALFSALPAPPSGLRAAPRGQSAAIALFAGFPAVLGLFSPFSAHDEKGLPIRPKKTSRISAARNSFLRAAARIYMTPCEGSCCRSGRQLSATLCATASQYLAAVRGGHALAEAVLLGALTLLRLERSLHNFVHLPVLKFTDGHRHRSGARRGHMPLPVCIIGYDIYYPI